MSFKFDTVAIVDSLPTSEEPQTAIWLRDVILKPLSEVHGIRLWYYRVENQADLFEVLADLAAAVRDVGLAPIVHFESHGVEQGLVLANGEVVPWADLKPWLTNINQGCHMNLLTVMSMCHGWHLVSQLQPVEPAPVWGLIGPIHKVLPARLQEAFQAFYPELLNALDGRAAVEAMNAARAGTKWELKIETAEVTFCKVWRKYEQEACTPEARQAREDQLVVQMMRQSRYDLRFAIHGRLFARQWLADNERLFGQFHRSFLMLDLFPENGERFQMTYQHCIKAAS
jgi:hypothetical protein